MEKTRFVYCCPAFNSKHRTSKNTDSEMKKTFLIVGIQLTQQTSSYHMPGTRRGTKRNPGAVGFEVSLQTGKTEKS